MKAFPTASIGLLPLILMSSSCVQRHVSESVESQAALEGRRYASEVEAQSPFETVEISWRDAERLMKERNPDYRTAQAEHAKALEETPLVEELTDQVKDIVGISFGDLANPDKLARSIQAPVTQLPKQLASISKLKNLPHEIEQDTWDRTAESVLAEIRMREQEVKLHHLLKTGAIIDRELACLETAPALPQDTDPKAVAARGKWHERLEKEHDAWLEEVRDLFDAEYHDVVFKEDSSGLPTYEEIEAPDLSEWNRWCRLQRSNELVGVLKQAHEKDKSTIPGTRTVAGKIGELFNVDLGDTEVQRSSASVRNEVRNLIRNWREMKEAQQRAEQLEARHPSGEINSIAQVDTRQTIYELRQREIKHASAVWMLDEECWTR